MAIRYELLSESHLMLRFPDTVDEKTLNDIQLAIIIAKIVFESNLIDLTPSFTTLLIEFDCLCISPWQAKISMQKQLSSLNKQKLPAVPSKHIDIPVYYHPDVGWDLLTTSESNGLSWQDIVTQHQAASYRVYALGFAPGFAFMGQLATSLHTQRKSTPRVRVPSGSVAIAELQTAIYPQSGPGGWNIIGRSPKKLFDATAITPNQLNCGDTVSFKAINRQEFLKLGGEIEYNNEQ